MSVFLSYAPSDAHYARELAGALRASGVAAATPAADVVGGEPLALAVERALERSSAVVVVLGKGTEVSPWTAFEIGHAVGLGKPILAVGRAAGSGLHVLDRAVTFERGRPDEVARQLKKALGEPRRS